MTPLFYINIIQIMVSIALIVIIMIQARSSGLGSVFGGDSSMHKTRRGVEKSMHQATIGICIAFFAISIVSVVLAA